VWKSFRGQPLNITPTELNDTTSTETITAGSHTEDSPNRTEIPQEVPGGEMVKATKQQIVSFMDEGRTRMENASIANLSVPKSMKDSATQDMKTHTILDFLQRPIPMATFNWTTSHTHSILGSPVDASIFEPLFWMDLPNFFFAGGQKKTLQMLQKLAGFNWVRGNFTVRVQVNAQKFQAGRLRIFAFPYPLYAGNSLASRMMTPQSILNLPGVDLDLDSESHSELNLDWVGPALFHNLTTGGPIIWRLMIMPYFGINLGVAQITVYCYFKNVELKMPTGVPLYNYQADVLHNVGSIPNARATFQVGGEAQKMEEQGTVEKVSGTVAKVTGMLAKVPVIGEYAEVASWVASGVESVAKFFGWSKPLSASTTTFFKNQPSRHLLNSDGVDTSHSLALFATNELERVPGWGGSKLDETHLGLICSMESYYDFFNWKADSTVQYLWAAEVQPFLAPSFMVLPVANPSNRMFGMTNIAYVAKDFGLWRGDITFIFRIIKNKYYSGRLRISFMPSGFSGNALTGSYDPDYCVQSIWDIKETNEFSFTCPYTNYKQWRPIAIYPISDEFDPQFPFSGSVVIEEINDLQAASTVPNNLNIMVFVRGEQNIEFAAPQNPTVFAPIMGKVPKEFGNESHIPSLKTYAAPPSMLSKVRPKSEIIQKEAPKSISKTLNQLLPIKASFQSGGAVAGTATTMAPFELDKKAAKSGSNILMNIVERSKVAAKTCVGEMVVSYRQLMKRFVRAGKYAQVYHQVADDSEHVYWYQPNSLSYIINNDEAIEKFLDTSFVKYQDWTHSVQNLYAFRRGGKRVKTQVHRAGHENDEDKWMNIVVQNKTPVFYTGATYGSENDFKEADGNGVNNYQTCSGTLPVNIDLEGMIETEVPYYSSAHCLINEMRYMHYLPNTDDGKNYMGFRNRCFNYDTVKADLEPENFLIFSAADYGSTTSGNPLTFTNWVAAKDDFDVACFLGAPTMYYRDTNFYPSPN